MTDEPPNVEQPPPAEPDPGPDAAPTVPQTDDDVGEVSAEQTATEALQQAEEAVQSIAEETGVDEDAAEAVPLPDLTPEEPSDEQIAASLGLLHDVDLNVKIELGRTRMYVEDVLRLNENSVIELDKAAGDPVDIFVNDQHVARGEVLVLNENFCVRISEIIQPAKAEER